MRLAATLTAVMIVAGTVAPWAALAQSTAPVTRAVLTSERIAQIIASPDRGPQDREADKRRKPEQVLGFIGIWPGMSALDISASNGYTTELLARAIGPTGRVYGQTGPAFQGVMPPPGTRGPTPGVPPVRMSTRSPSATVATFEKRNGIMKQAGAPAATLIALTGTFEAPIAPDLIADGLDLVTLMNNYHDLGYLGTDRAAMNQAIFRALKSGGLYIITDYAGRTGTGISEANTMHRIEESFLRKEVEAAGFKLDSSADFLRNPKDPRNTNIPAEGQAKDVFVLKFVKP